jgi:hypothetical protein
MAGFSTYLQEKVLDHIRGKTAYTMPTAYVALFTVNPTDGGGGTEANYTGYSRVTTAGADWTAASGTNGTNASAITFGLCTAGTNTITGFGLYDASSGGNLLLWGTCSISVSAGITPSFAAAALDTNLD